MKKCHNGRFFKTDTWEVLLGITHMTVLSFNLGVSFMKWGFLSSALKEQPVDREFCKIFIELNDYIMKKVMFHRDLPNQHIFIKSHLLMVARELEQRYNDTKFLTVVRDPIYRKIQQVYFWHFLQINCKTSFHLHNNIFVTQ